MRKVLSLACSLYIIEQRKIGQRQNFVVESNKFEETTKEDHENEMGQRYTESFRGHYLAN